MLFISDRSSNISTLFDIAPTIFKISDSSSYAAAPTRHSQLRSWRRRRRKRRRSIGNKRPVCILKPNGVSESFKESSTTLHSYLWKETISILVTAIIPSKTAIAPVRVFAPRTFFQNCPSREQLALPKLWTTMLGLFLPTWSPSWYCKLWRGRRHWSTEDELWVLNHYPDTVGNPSIQFYYFFTQEENAML